MPRTPYPTDLTDAQWEKIAVFLPQPKKNGRTGRPRVYAYRDILDALFYQIRSGDAWRMLPHDFPPWDTAYGYIRRWKRDRAWERIHDASCRKGGTRGHDREDKATNQRRTPTNVEDTSAENLNDVRDKNSRVCVCVFGSSVFPSCPEPPLLHRLGLSVLGILSNLSFEKNRGIPFDFPLITRLRRFSSSSCDTL
jgi:transposase